MDYKFILIVSTPRSASTTLQRILNTLPNSNITGEKWGAIHNILECYRKIKKTVEYTPKTNNGEFMTSLQIENSNFKPCFYNSFDFVYLKKQIQELIINMLTNSRSNRILGFKEIRWNNKMELIDEFLELFPNTKIICHIQEDIVAQAKSTFFDDKGGEYNYLKTYTAEIVEYARKNEKCYLSTRETLFDFENIKKMCVFLEESIHEGDYINIINNDPEKKK